MQLAHVKVCDCTCLIRSYAVSHDDKMMSDKERADYKKAWQLFADYADKNDDAIPLPRGLIRDIAEAVQVSGELSPGYVRAIDGLTRVFRAGARLREAIADGRSCSEACRGRSAAFRVEIAASQRRAAAEGLEAEDLAREREAKSSAAPATTRARSLALEAQAQAALLRARADLVVAQANLDATEKAAEERTRERELVHKKALADLAQREKEFDEMDAAAQARAWYELPLAQRRALLAGVEYPPPPAKRARNHEVQ